MRQVEVEFKSTRNGEVLEGRYVLEKRAGPGSPWKEVEVIAVRSGTAGAKRQFLLEENERVVVEGGEDVAPIFHREQSAAMRGNRDA